MFFGPKLLTPGIRYKGKRESISWAFRRFITATCCCNTTDSLWRPAALPGFDPASNLGRPSPRLSCQLGEGAAELDGETPAEARRRALVEHVARELLENLLFTGSENPVVQEVRRELDHRLNGRFSFWYPPGEVDVRIVRESPEGPRELSDEERREVLTELWDITLAKVDATML